MAEVIIRQNTVKTGKTQVSVILRKMKKAVKHKLKILGISLKDYLDVEKSKKGNSMPFFFDFTRAGIGDYIEAIKGYKIIRPTGMTPFAYIYLTKKDMIVKSKVKGWLIRPLKYAKCSYGTVTHTWEDYVHDNFPRLSEKEANLMRRGDYLPDSVKARLIKQYTDGKGWCQVGNYDDEPGCFIQCHDKSGRIVFHEDLPVFLKIATIVKFKKMESSAKKPKMPKALEPKPRKPAEKMNKKEIYQYIYAVKGERVKKVPGEEYGVWKFKGVPHDIFSEALKHRFIKKVKNVGWVLIK